MAMPTLRYGQSGQNVKILQMALNTLGYGLVEDGIFGSKTQSAVKDYQGGRGLAIDGVVGDQVWGALLLETSLQPGSNTSGLTISPSSSSPITISPNSTIIPNLSATSSPSASTSPVNWTKMGMIALAVLGVIYFMQKQ